MVKYILLGKVFSILFRLAVYILFFVSMFSPLHSQEKYNTINHEFEEISILSSDHGDREWKVLYAKPDGYLSNHKKKNLLKSLFEKYPKSDPIAIFLYSAYSSEIETNRKIKYKYEYSETIEEIEHEDIYNYSSFLRVYCRIPTATKMRLEKAGKLEGNHSSRVKKEIECEKDWISRTWKGNGFHFWIHKHYYRLPDVTTPREIPDFLLYLGTVLGMSYFSLFLLFLLIKYLFLKFIPCIRLKLLSILGPIFFGASTIALAGILTSSDNLTGPGLGYYIMNLSIFSGVYTILCFVPFWGLTNYLILDEDTFPLWLILLGFILAPLLVFAAGSAMRGGSRSSSNQNSSGGDSSSLSSGGGSFGGGGASGEW